MAATDLSPWIPEDWDSKIYMSIRQTSAAEGNCRRVPMSTLTKRIPRLGESSDEVVPKSTAYPESPTEMDDVELRARKFGKIERLADEDLKDQPLATIATFQQNWANTHARHLDNCVFAVTGTENGTTVPFTSVYAAVRADDADTDYTADDNYLAVYDSSAGDDTIWTDGPSGYDTLSAFLALTEEGDWFDEPNMLFIAHPAFKRLLRGIKNSQGDPMFQEGMHQGGSSQLFGHRIKFSNGLRTSATRTARPTGNPLMIFGSTELMALGIRSGPEYQTAGPDSGAAFSTDEALLKMRSRRGFKVTVPNGISVLEKFTGAGPGV